MGLTGWNWMRSEGGTTLRSDMLLVDALFGGICPYTVVPSTSKS